MTEVEPLKDLETKIESVVIENERLHLLLKNK
jgi:hypothetical protein